MKITAVNNFKINFPNRKTNPILSFKSDCKDELIISQKPTAEEISKEYFKEHKGKFTISDYKNLSEVEAKAIDYTIPKTTREAAELSYIAGTCLKDYFDEKFGEDNYIYVCIGTSPSGIGRVMEFSGVETKYIPLTGFRMDPEIRRKWTDKYRDGVEHYKEFLKSQGIDEKMPQNTKKQIIFTDFVYSGYTLENFEGLLIDEFNFPRYEMNVHFLNLEEELKHAIAKKDPCIEDKRKLNRFMKSFLLYGEMANYGGVPHLELKEFEKFDPSKIKRKPREKQFNFEIMRRLNEAEQLKENPLNKDSL